MSLSVICTCAAIGLPSATIELSSIALWIPLLAIFPIALEILGAILLRIKPIVAPIAVLVIIAPGNVYCLIEHQSSPDRHMAFRLIRYAIAAMQRHLDAGNEQLPLVVPLLFYHGQITPYLYSMRWLDEFGDPDMVQQLYTGDFPLVDVTVIPDDEIMQHRRMAILELLQKHVRQRDLAELLEQLVTLLLAGYTTNEQLASLMNYMLQVGDTASPETFIRELARRAPQHEEVLMTIAQKLEQKGLERGLEKGRLEGIQLGEAKGRQEGVLEGELAVVRTMLANGIDRDCDFILGLLSLRV